MGPIKHNSLRTEFTQLVNLRLVMFSVVSGVLFVLPIYFAKSLAIKGQRETSLDEYLFSIGFSILLGFAVLFVINSLTIAYYHLLVKKSVSLRSCEWTSSRRIFSASAIYQCILFVSYAAMWLLQISSQSIDIRIACMVVLLFSCLKIAGVFRAFHAELRSASSLEDGTRTDEVGTTSVTCCILGAMFCPDILLIWLIILS